MLASSPRCELASTSTSTATIKTSLREALAGVDRGIFGLPAAKKQAILQLIGELEAHNAIPNPVERLELVQGDWRLLYSTIVITGAKKTKLGLREFVKLGDFIQRIDTASSRAVNEISFSVTGLGSISGALTISASYAPAGPQRVDIAYGDATLTPVQLQKVFQSNLDLLLNIFNPEGHLDITYLDDTWRVGRDDKGNVFLLERVAAAGGSAGGAISSGSSSVVSN